MAANDPNTPEEEILNEDEYPQRPRKQPMMNSDPDERSDSSNFRGPPAPRADEDMYYNPERYVPIMELKNCQLRKKLAEATKRNEELARLAAEAQAAQAPPPQATQPPPPRDTQAPPRRPRGRPRKNAATRRAEKAPPPTSPPVQPRPRRGNQAEATANPIAAAHTGMGNNRAPSVARTPNLGAAENVPEPNRANSRPSRPNHGRQPPSSIRHPPSSIRHPSPIQDALRPAPQNRDRQAGWGHGNGEAARDHRAPQHTRSQMSWSRATGTRKPAGDPPRNH
ncbi:uncharacterized protein LOC133805624 [Humulus lupulus]|uniref:uncharacterized protein LOC133805624 n=1 Tax=Humulus lupulus TaxID=3486 RepID=UPI002B406837|nr:uncharacterized protein LOC133805624 [Humulus lupulus]